RAARRRHCLPEQRRAPTAQPVEWPKEDGDAWLPPCRRRKPAPCRNYSRGELRLRNDEEERAVAALDAEQGAGRPILLQELCGVVGGGDRLAVDLDDDVALLNARVLSGAALAHAGHDRTLLAAVGAQPLRQLGRERLEADPQLGLRRAGCSRAHRLLLLTGQ